MTTNSTKLVNRTWLAAAILSALIGVASSQTAMAQEWTTTGNDISNTNTGNVGVGTSTPTYKFDVLSTTNIVGRFGSTAAAHNHLLINAPSGFNSNLTLQHAGLGKWYLGNRATNDRFSFSNAGGSAEVFSILQNGNVGIGTTTPQESLTVSATSNPTIAIDGPAIDFSSTQQSAFGAYADQAGGLSLANNGTGGLWVQSFNKSAASGIGTYFTSYSQNDLTAYSSFQFVAKLHNGSGSLTSHAGGAKIFSVLNNTTNLFNILGSGNVGIGTTAPTRLVSLNATSTPYLSFNESGTEKALIGTEAAGYNRRFIVYDSSAAQYRLVIDNLGNVGIGKTDPQYKLDVVGDIKASGTIHAKYQDVAEWVPSSEQLSAGTVVVLDTTKSNQVISCTQAYDTRVAGVISAQPGITLGEGGEGKVLVATTGRVRVKVDASRGAIQIGDLLVTSDVLGVAMKSEPVEFAGRKMHMPGTIVGKALEPLEKGKGEILVLLSLQ